MAFYLIILSNLFGSIAIGAPKTGGTLSYIDSKSPGSVYCPKHMVGHRSQESEIAICVQGNANYSDDILNIARDKDWFKDDDGFAGLVSEVRFVCAFVKDDIPKHPRVIFPTKSESRKKRSARVEIPCSFDETEVKIALLNAQKLILDSSSEGTYQSVVKKSTILAEKCDINPLQPECEKWKKILASIFAADELNSYGNVGRYCGMNFGVGLDSSQRVSIRKMLVKSLAPPNLDKPIHDCDDTELSARRQEYNAWIYSQLPESCANPIPQEQDPAKQKQQKFVFKECWDALMQLNAKLKDAWKLNADGHDTLLDNHDCYDDYPDDCTADPKHTRKPLCVVGQMLGGAARDFLKRKAESEKPENMPEEQFLAKFDRKQLADIFKKLSDGYTYRLNSQGQIWTTGNFAIPQKVCGWDPTCWSIATSMSRWVGNNESKKLQNKQGCWVIASYNFDSDPVTFQFEIDSSCGKEE